MHFAFVSTVLVQFKGSADLLGTRWCKANHSLPLKFSGMVDTSLDRADDPSLSAWTGLERVVSVFCFRHLSVADYS